MAERPSTPAGQTSGESLKHPTARSCRRNWHVNPHGWSTIRTAAEDRTWGEHAFCRGPRRIMHPANVSTLSQADRTDLRRAKRLLENPGLAARIANTLGTPIERLFAALPAG